MCWSWEVSLSFATFQVLSLGYITYRNKYIDRWYVLVCLPFAGQEICQFILWSWGDIENVDGDEPFQCNQTNDMWSKILIADFFLIPLFISFFAYKTSVNSNKCLLFMWKYWFYFQLITYFIIVPWMMIDKECVSVGTHGHQKWPPLFTPQYFTKYIGKWPTTIIISIYYYPTICLVAIFYKPLWVSSMPSIYGILSIIILTIIIGDEAYSVWCWSCACITIWVLIYVPITRHFVKNWKNKHLNDEQLVVDDLFGSNICCKLFFKDSHHHLDKYWMLDEKHDYQMDAYSDIDGIDQEAQDQEAQDQEAQELPNHDL